MIFDKFLSKFDHNNNMAQLTSYFEYARPNINFFGPHGGKQVSALHTVTKGNEKKVACDRTEKKRERSQSKVQTIVLVPSALVVA